MANPNPSPATRIPQINVEPLAQKIIGVRLPVKMDALVREIAGKNLSSWVREAIAEKLEREQHVFKEDSRN